MLQFLSTFTFKLNICIKMTGPQFVGFIGLWIVGIFCGRQRQIKWKQTSPGGNSTLPQLYDDLGRVHTWCPSTSARAPATKWCCVLGTQDIVMFTFNKPSTCSLHLNCTDFIMHALRVRYYCLITALYGFFTVFVHEMLKRRHGWGRQAKISADYHGNLCCNYKKITCVPC